MKCPYCGSSWTKKAGKRKNKYVTKQGGGARNAIGSSSSGMDFEGMTYPKEIILEVLHLYVAGLSLSNIRDFMQQHRGYTIYESRILDWVRKLREKAFPRRSRSRKPRPLILVDETCVKAKGKKLWIWLAYDPNLGEILSLRASWQRSGLVAWMVPMSVRGPSP